MQTSLLPNFLSVTNDIFRDRYFLVLSCNRDRTSDAQFILPITVSPLLVQFYCIGSCIGAIFYRLFFIINNVDTYS